MLHGYQIESVIGHGGFGITYKAHDTDFNQTVAIKEYLPSDLAYRDEKDTVRPLTDEQKGLYDWGMERFLSEGRTLEEFRHPNVIKVHNVFQDNNTVYMVMEYAEGEDMQDLMRKGFFHDERSLLQICVPICDGLAHVHEAGFVHRDIKPANIFVRTDGSPVLLDFGSARQAVAKTGPASTMTSLVTPGFAPFEQYNDDARSQGPWSDIYAFGATLYLALTGRPPVDALVRSHSFLNQTQDPYEPATKVGGRQFSTRFLRAIDHALCFREQDRPQNANDWSRMLQGLDPVPNFGGATTTDRRPAPAKGAKKQGRKIRLRKRSQKLPKKLLILIGSLSAALLIGIGVYLYAFGGLG